MIWVAIIGFVAFLAIVYASVEATRRLLEVHVQSGRVTRLEGRAPADLTNDIRDVVARSKASGTIIVRLEGDRAAVKVSSGIDEVTAQRLRNVVGRFPTARLRTARRVRRG